ncbi:MAG: hypothetical protein HUU48_07725 [Flavobacteriales bacterium]|nr:hypothetical protein [Flavobacteriales bacterium]
MKKNLALLSTIVAVMLMVSCAPKVPYSNSVRDQYNLKTDEIKKLQFFVSNDILLQRGEQTAEEKNTDKTGKLVISSSASVEQVLIKKGTPGVCVDILDGNKIAVSFETDDKFIVFGDATGRGRYSLMASEWKDGRGKLDYGGRVYYAQPGSAATYVIIQMKKVKKFKKQARTVGGRKV